jgi:hypothetical protein
MFYVYELKDTLGKTFYVGKGSGNRMRQHEVKAKRGCYTKVCRKIRELWNIGHLIFPVVVFETENEKEAFQEEIRRIALYGRENLTNETDGGDGPSNPSEDVRRRIALGRTGIKISEKTRERLRVSHLGKRQTKATRKKISKAMTGTKHPWAKNSTVNLGEGFKGHKWSEEHRRKFLEKRKGHAVTQETRDKISQSKKGSIPWNKKQN